MSLLYRSIVAGFFIFAAFFGSGNTVFPVMIGEFCLEKYPMGFLGLFFIDILLPVLGIYVMALFHGNYQKLFYKIGFLGQTLSFVIIMLIGPFGILSRTVIVSYSNIQIIFPFLDPIVYGVCFCAMIYLIIRSKTGIINIIGNVITPVLLFLSFFIISFKTNNIPGTTLNNVSNFSALKFGALSGVQNLDLVVSLFYCLPVIKYLKKHTISDKKFYQAISLSSFIMIILMSIISFGITKLGANNYHIISNITPEQKINAIVTNKFGQMGTLIASAIIFFACFTTAVASFESFVSYLKEKFEIKNIIALFITFILTIFISQLGFFFLFNILSTVLSVFYPILVIFLLYAIKTKKYSK